MKELRLCTVCGERKGEELFPKQQRKKTVNHGSCRSCENIRRKEYRLRNLEKEKLRYKKYLLNNKEKVKKAREKYYQDNKEIINIKGREYHQKNREKCLNKMYDYYKKNKDRIIGKNKECNHKDNEKNIIRCRRYKEANREKIDAHNAVKSALTRKILTKEPCLACGEMKVDAHHPDYNYPLNVIWLCRKHHREIHRSI